jgi:ATP-dependent Clp protease protease subunit
MAESAMAKMGKDQNESSFSKLNDRIDGTILDARRIFISDAIDNESAKAAIRNLWYLELSDPGKPILLIINSPGGSVDSGLAIWDQVQMISSPVATLVTGLAASMGSVLSLCAAPNMRFATPHSRILIHQPRLSGAIQGQATDLDIQAREMIKTRALLEDLYMKATGKDRETISKAIDRDTWMNVYEALEFKLLDKVISSYEELKKEIG